MRQHLTCVNAATGISGAQVQGAAELLGLMRPAPYALAQLCLQCGIGTTLCGVQYFRPSWPALMLAGDVRATQERHAQLWHRHSFSGSQLCCAAACGCACTTLAATLRFLPRWRRRVSRAWRRPPGNFNRLTSTSAVADRAVRRMLGSTLPLIDCAARTGQLGSMMGWQPEQLRATGVRQNEGPTAMRCWARWPMSM